MQYQKTGLTVSDVARLFQGKGANIEHIRAMRLGQEVFFSLGDLPCRRKKSFRLCSIVKQACMIH
jgi:hypothetical protein